MPEQISNNKRIAKNTLILYFRMGITLIVSLYTSRVILAALGVEDYGIYNVVGGVVALLNIISGSMTAATGRFLSYELGRGQDNQLNETFSTLLNVHIMIGVVVLILGEVLGMWFLENKLNIPPDRIEASIWVLQFSLLSFFFTVINVPYSASVVSHEEMGVFAYISIFEVIAKLAVAFILTYTQHDRLIVYALLLAVVSIITQFVYYIYCRKFDECRFRIVFDTSLIKNIVSFIGWAFLGNASVVIKNQGVTVLLNMFFGPVVNAAQGVANQVESISSRFVYSYMMAANPQIIKLYSADEKPLMHNLIFRSSKFSAFLLLLLLSPVVLNIDLLLGLWLKEVPDHSSAFVVLTLIYAFLDTLTAPLVTGVLSTAKIKRYELLITFSYLAMVAVIYACFKLGMAAEVAFIVSILCKLVVLFILLFESNKLYDLPLGAYLKRVVVPVFLPLVAPIGVYIGLKFIVLTGLSQFLISSVVVTILLASIIWLAGLETGEKDFIKNTIHTKVLSKLKSNGKN